LNKRQVKKLSEGIRTGLEVCTPKCNIGASAVQDADSVITAVTTGAAVDILVSCIEFAGSIGIPFGASTFLVAVSTTVTPEPIDIVIENPSFELRSLKDGFYTRSVAKWKSQRAVVVNPSADIARQIPVPVNLTFDNACDGDNVLYVFAEFVHQLVHVPNPLQEGDQIVFTFDHIDGEPEFPNNISEPNSSGSSEFTSTFAGRGGFVECGAFIVPVGGEPFDEGGAYLMPINPDVSDTCTTESLAYTVDARDKFVGDTSFFLMFGSSGVLPCVFDFARATLYPKGAQLPPL
jgi:hypothetical protein